MENPLEFVKLKSKFQRSIYLSFDIVLEDDIISLRFTNFPRGDSTLLCEYRSTKHGAGLIPIQGLGKASEVTPNKIAIAFCEKKQIKDCGTIENIQKDYVDFHVPEFIKLGPVYPNYPEIDSKIERVEGYVLFADLRGFSTWSMHAEPEQIYELYDVISSIIVEYVSDYQFDYWKLLGDGIMLIWEEGSERNSANSAIGAGFDLHKQYWYYRRDCLHQVPEGFGIAICGGYLTKFRSATFFESCIINDYLGPIVNQASRLQSLAKAGQVLVNRRVKKTSDNDWFSFEDISEKLKEEISDLKGLSPFEREVFIVHHKYFGPNWEKFIRKV